MNTIERAIAANPGAVLIAVANVLPDLFEKNGERENSEMQFYEDTEPKLIDPEKQIEIVDGEVVIKEMAGARRGGVAARIIIKIGAYLENNPIGNLYTADTLFSIGGK